MWKKLSEIIEKAAGLGEFPAHLLSDIVSVLQENIANSTAFDELIEKLAEFMSERSKEVTAGRLYLKQGEKKLRDDKPIDGIKYLGRAIVNFAKEECREEQSTALYYLSVAYNAAGLLWAARSTALASIVQNLALYTAKLTLLYRLGHFDVLRTDDLVPKNVTDQEVFDMIKMMAAQPACCDLPKKLILLDGAFISIQTKILGAEITITTSTTIEELLEAESHVATLESFAATLLNRHILPYREKLLIQISQYEGIREASISPIDNNIMLISLPLEWELQNALTNRLYNQHLIDFSIQVVAGIVILPEAPQTLKEWLKTGLVFERATLFSNIGISRQRVFGSCVGQITDWDKDISRSYSLSDNAPPIPIAAELPLPLTNDINDDNFQPLLGNLRSHRDLHIRSIINVNLWDEASWQGMMYGWSDIGQPPILGLLFKNKEKGRAIFREWLDRLGKDDCDNEIRVSVLKGIDRKKPFSYRGHITQEHNVLPVEKGKLFVNMSRINTMTPSNHQNLNLFVKHLDACGHFFLVPAIMGVSGIPEFQMDLTILKHKFYVREAWEVGLHDIDMMALQSDDNVIIPADEKDPPVKKLLEYLNERKKG